jgi:hypothetical protein
MKKSILAVIILVIAAIVIVVAVKSFSPKQDWVCRGGEWVSIVDNPGPKPNIACGNNKPNDQKKKNNSPKAILGSIARSCEAEDGKWLPDFRECENITREWCDKYNGEYSECASACRNNPSAEICTLQCLQVCKINEVIGEGKSINVNIPKKGARIKSPVKITGQARGTWFFEGDFPVELHDFEGNIIAKGYVSARSSWMTEDFVPFSGELKYDIPENLEKRRAKLILKKDNPSGLPENDESFEIDVKI